MWRIDLKEMLRITYSVEFVCHLHQLLVHLDPDVLALKHSGQRKQITNEPSAVTCCNKLLEVNNCWTNVTNSTSTCPAHDSSVKCLPDTKMQILYTLSTLALSLKLGDMS